MNNYLFFLRVSSSIFLASYLSFGLFSKIIHGEDVSDLISSSEDLGAKEVNEASGLIDAFRKNAVQESTSTGKIVSSLNNGSGNGSRNGRVVSSNKGGTSSVGAKFPPLAPLRKYPKQETLKDMPLPHEGKKKCKDNASQGSGKCPSSLFEGLQEKESPNSSSNIQLLIFVSQSVPENSIKELWNQAQKVGGKLLFRGLVGGSFKETQSYIEELGIVAEIDPTKFEEFKVIHVPTFVLSKTLVSPIPESQTLVSLGDKYDKMVGNVSLDAFLEQASISGDLLSEASSLYKKLHTRVLTPSVLTPSVHKGDRS